MSKKWGDELLCHPEVESWRALMGAFQAIYRKLENALLKEGCSVSRFQILFLLYFEGPVFAVDISKHLFVTRGNISMFLRRLQSDGLIDAVPSGQSPKRTLFSLTEKGEHFFEAIFPDHIKRVRVMMPPLDQKMIRHLRKIITDNAIEGKKCLHINNKSL